MAEQGWDGDGVPLAESNCAGIGGDEDKAIRKTAASMELAWKGAGTKAGLQVWRIEDFQVVPWDSSKYGEFHEGDSYIVLETQKVEGILHHHIYFWLGESTSIDEKGVAAYKTVELDDLFDGLPTQSREVQGQESKQFRKLFPSITYLKGGKASAFRHSVADIYEARLYQVRKVKGRGVVTQEVPLARDSLNEGDCFVLDAGKRIYIWQGSSCDPMEKYESNVFAERIETRRAGHAKADHDCDDQFWEHLGGKGPIKPKEEGRDLLKAPELGDGVLFRLSDASGTLKIEEVGRLHLDKSMLCSDDVMLLDHYSEICLWVGRGADDAERRNAFRAAFDFLKYNDRDPNTAIHMYKEGSKINNPVWNAIFQN